MIPARGWRTAFVAGLVLTAGALTEPADAQYFGRNRVRYTDFDFRILKTEHFDLYYYPGEADAAELAARMAERWYDRLSRLLSFELRGRQPIILYASPSHFRQTTALPGAIGEATQGATEPLRRRVVLPLAGSLRETDHVLGHELVHAFQFDMTNSGLPGLQGPSALVLPLWFVEGMAEYLSVGPVDPHTAMWLRDAVRSDSLPTIAELSDPRFFPYRFGHALWAYIAGRWGDRIVREVFREAGASGDPSRAIRRVLAVTADDLSRDWHRALRETFGLRSDSGRAIDHVGRPIFAGNAGAGQLQLAPALSPDGRRLVFLSERDQYSVDVFLGDVEEGRVLRKLVGLARDPHFESIQFLQSAGAWHPDGRRFAIAGVHGGHAVATVLDVERGRIEREYRIRDADEIYHPAWSPDGARLAFTGLAGGLLDLFLLDAGTGEIRRLTNDPYADFQPVWSPDGRRIAFVSDRFTGGLTSLWHGEYQLAFIDPGTGAIESAGVPAPGKQITPQWSPDGSALYFLSDGWGAPNVYRWDLEAKAVRRVTDAQTGVSGITPLSPAFSVAGLSGRLAYTVYEQSNYRLYAADADSVLAGVPAGEPAGAAASRLPPADRLDPEIPALLANPLFGLPGPDWEPTTERYRPGLALDFLAPLSVGVGSGGYGTVVGGGTAAFFSDMLGWHNLAATVQVSGTLRDIGALVAYRNVQDRWIRSVVAGQTPILSLGFRRNTVDDGDLVVDSLYRFRQIDRQVTGILAYPFSRVQRLELQGGFRASSFDEEVLVRTITRQPPLVDVSDPVTLSSPDGIQQAEFGAAWVYDNALFGPTSPVVGQRFRLEATPSLGTVRYVTVLGDFRRYVMPVRPYTLAARVIHFGRYGPDTDDARLRPYFIGYQTLVRGYGFRSFDLQDCPALIRQPEDCSTPGFDRLLGSRIAIANVELRVPLRHLLGLERGSGFPPLELALFGDAGVAWTGSTEPTFLGGTHKPATSYGAALRLPFFGITVLELDIVHPNDRPDRGWHLVFGLNPGF